MDKETIIKIVCYTIAIGAVIGFFLYKSNESKQKEYAQAYQSSQAEQNYRKHVEEQKKASNAEYQVKEAYKSLVAIENSLGAELGSADYIYKRREARNNLSHWIDVREEELKEELRQAKASGNTQKIRQCQQELEKLDEKKEILYN